MGESSWDVTVETGGCVMGTIEQLHEVRERLFEAWGTVRDLGMDGLDGAEVLKGRISEAYFATMDLLDVERTDDDEGVV